MILFSGATSRATGLLVCGATAVCLTPAVPSAADDFVWTGGTDSDFSNPSNWTNVSVNVTDTDGVPDTDDNVAFNGVDVTTTNGSVAGLATDATGVLRIAPGSVSVNGGPISNAGTIAFAGDTTTGIDERLVILGNVSLTGGGEVVLAEDGDQFITGNAAIPQRLINVDNTIRGSGAIDVEIINNSTIIAEGGTLNVSEFLENFGGNIQVAADGVFSNDGRFDGFTSTLGGTITVADGGMIAGRFDDSTFAGTVTIAPRDSVGGLASSTFFTRGTYTNTGTLTFAINQFGINEATINVSDEITLTGGGEVVLVPGFGFTPSFGNFVNGSITNLDNTIRGAGEFDQLPVNNVQGTIFADSSDGALSFGGLTLGPAGTTAVVLDGVGFADSGAIDAGSDLTLDGVLELVVGSALNVEVGDTYTFLTARSVSSNFALVDQSQAGGFEFDVVVGPDSVSVEVLAIPEPGTVAGLSLLVYAVGRRRNSA